MLSEQVLGLFRICRRRLSISLLGCCYLLESNEVVVLEELLFLYLPEPCCQYLLGENFLSRPDVIEYPCRAFPFNAMKIDQDHLSSRPQRSVDRSHRLKRELEVVVSVANEGQVDGVGR